MIWTALSAYRQEELRAEAWRPGGLGGYWKHKKIMVDPERLRHDPAVTTGRVPRLQAAAGVRLPGTFARGSDELLAREAS